MDTPCSHSVRPQHSWAGQGCSCSVCSVSRDPLAVWDQAVSCSSDLAQHKATVLPSHCTFPSQHPSPYSLAEFVSLCQQKFLCGGCSAPCSCCQHTAHSFPSVSQVRQVPCHHPPITRVSDFSQQPQQGLHGQRDLSNRAAAPTAISPETLHKFSLKNTGQACMLQRSKLVLPNTE